MLARGDVSAGDGAPVPVAAPHESAAAEAAKVAKVKRAAAKIREFTLGRGSLVSRRLSRRVALAHEARYMKPP